jgi:hypothetical protein
MVEVGRRRRGWKQWLLAAEALLLLTIFRIALATLPLRWILRMTTRGIVAESQEHDETIALEVRWAVEAVVRHAPLKFVCFPQALAGYTMLRWRGVQSEIVYGVMRSASGELLTHTWLDVGEKTVLGGKGAGEFTAVDRWR